MTVLKRFSGLRSDESCRLSVPVEMLTAIGLGPKSLVEISVVDDTIVITGALEE